MGFQLHSNGILMMSCLHRWAGRFYWAGSSAGIYLHISVGQERPCSQPYTGYSCRILRCWHTPHQGKSYPEHTHPHLEAEISIKHLKLFGESKSVVYLHNSVRQQKVQIQACSSHRRRNRGCWRTRLRSTHYPPRTHWHLTERHGMQTLYSHAAAPQVGALHSATQPNPLQTFTAPAVRGDLVTMVTGTFISAIQIDTAAMETDTREEALVDVWRRGDMEEEKKGASEKGEYHQRFVGFFFISSKRSHWAYVTGV